MIVLRGTNASPTNSTYYILSSTNVTTPLSNWTRLETNQFLNDGTFSFTNTGTLPKRFYLLQVP
jgi:hypothetical protein